MKKLILVLMFTVVLIGMGTTKVMAGPYFMIEDGGSGGGSCDYTFSIEESDVLLYRVITHANSLTDFNFTEKREKVTKTGVYAEVNGVCEYSETFLTEEYSVSKNQSSFDSSDIISINYEYAFYETYEMKLYDGDILIIEDGNDYFAISSHFHYDIRKAYNDTLNVPYYISRSNDSFNTTDVWGNVITCNEEGSSKLHVMPSSNNTYSTANDGNTKYKCDGMNEHDTYEIIVDAYGHVVNEAINMGTYNFGEARALDLNDHRVKDVIPWLIFGNAREDYSGSQERFMWYKNSTSNLRYYSGTRFDDIIEPVQYYDQYGRLITIYPFGVIGGVPFGDIDIAVNNNNS